MSEYVELRARSAFSFLRGASQPEDLVVAAGALDLGGIAVCDRDGVYGSARVHAAAKEAGVRAIVGAELTMEGGGVLPVLVKDRTGYRNLCQLITRAKLRGTKTECAVGWGEVGESAEGLVALWGGRADADGLDRLVGAFGKKDVCVEVRRHYLRGENRRNDLVVELAKSRGVRVVATNGVLYATPERRRVLDVFTCIRNHTHLDKAGRLLSANSERHLKSGKAMERLFRDLPEAITNTARVAERCEFSLENLGYEFPTLDVPEGQTMASWLRVQTYEGARRRYGARLSEAVRRQLERELTLITDLKFAGYFLIVWDLVNFCRDENILVQGRGSAANSVVCYCLGITACDPIKHKLLFERFLSESRKSWPDIDLDLPSGDRRERVIQEVYRRYGKHGAAMTANVITYRGRSAMREIGKALNFPPEILDRFSRLHAAGDFPHTLELRAQLEQAGLPVSHARSEAAIELYQQMRGLPRHLGQHSGGMIICRDALSSVVPLENASMPGRVVAQWDKDDCEDLGIVKVDLLGLGMMAVMQDSLEMCRDRRGDVRDMAAIPPDDAATYDLMCAADTVGTFQVESRAQMATLPKLKPRCFYDVVIQVAVIRPGPIQGGMLHPLFARRAGEEPVRYLHPSLEDTLERTYGVPLFQEQLLKMAMVMADFTGGEAEELRRALSFPSFAREDGQSVREAARGDGGEGHRRRGGGGTRAVGAVICGLRISREPRDQLCADRVRKLLVEDAPWAGIFLRVVKQSADGFLFGGDAGAGREGAGDQGAGGVGAHVGLALWGGRGRRGAAGVVRGAGDERGGGRADRARAGGDGIYERGRFQSADGLGQGRAAKSGADRRS